MSSVFLEYADYLNITTITETIPEEINLMLGILFIFIGITIMYRIYARWDIDRRRLKKFEMG